MNNQGTVLKLNKRVSLLYEHTKLTLFLFQRLGSLQEISMPQNGIYHVGVSALSEALTKCPQLRELNLNDNTLTWRGAAALANALPGLQHLRLLNLGDCLLKSKGAIILAEALTQGHQNLEVSSTLCL